MLNQDFTVVSLKNNKTETYCLLTKYQTKQGLWGFGIKIKTLNATGSEMRVIESKFVYKRDVLLELSSREIAKV